MKFEPRVPRDDVNRTPTHPLKEGAVLLFGALVLVAALVGVSALLVDRIVPFLPASWEAGLFPDFGALSEVPDTEGEKERQSELERLLSRLASRWADRDLELSIGVLDDPTPNAVAFPGGLILVTRGLLEVVETENELAFVLGHELGHFRNRDHLRSLGRGLALGLIVTAAGQGGSLGDLLALSGELSGRSFSREQERQADAFGLSLVAAEYGHVSGAAGFFEKLAAEESSMDRKLGSYFSTHPVSGERVREMEELARENDWAQKGDERPIFDKKPR